MIAQIDFGTARDLKGSQPTQNPTRKSSEKPEVQALQALAAEIRVDSKDDPLHYLVRSNTSHDGE